MITKKLLKALSLAACCFGFTSSFGQTPGFIVRPAGGTGSTVLNPNQDYYTSPLNTPFSTNDVSESEIKYKAVIPILSEPVSDVVTGPKGGFTDIVPSSVDDRGCYIYYDGTNLLIRLRIGSIVNGAKGYSILFDTDGKIGATGPNADPTYKAPTNSGNGNPGFEKEVALQTGGGTAGVTVYDVNNTTNPSPQKTYSLATNHLVSVALSRTSGDADYFYDFFVPITDLGIDTTTPLRIIFTTNTNPGSALHGTRSDIYGLDDANYKNTTAAWELIAKSTPSFTLNNISSTGSGLSPACTPAPTVNTGIPSGSNVAITGTWTRLDISKSNTATISVYKNGTLAGSTTATSGTPWAYTIASLVSGDVITAQAQASGESKCLTSNSVAVLSSTCSPSNITSTTGATLNACSNPNRGMSGTRMTNGVIKIYTISPTTDTLYATDGNPASPSSYNITYSTTTAWEYNGKNNGGQIDPCSGGAPDMPNAQFYFTVTDSVNGKCASAPIFGSCVGLTTTTAIPTISQSNLYPGSNTISGNATTNSSVRLFVNSFIVAKTTATAGTYSFANIVLQKGDTVTVREQVSGGCISSAASPKVVTCFTASPVITTDMQGNLTTGATTVTGTSTEAAGTTINFYLSPSALKGTTTVQPNGTWSLPVSSLASGTYFATAQSTGCSVSTDTSRATALAPTTVCPSFTGTYPEDTTKVSGTITALGGSGGTIYLYQDGAEVGNSTLTSTATTWTIIPTDRLYAGGVLTLGVQATNGTLKTDCPATTTVIAVPPAAPNLLRLKDTIYTNNSITYTVSNSKTGVLYYVSDASTGKSIAPSKFGTGDTLKFTTNIYPAIGTYNNTITADKLSGSTSKAVTNAELLVLANPLPVQLMSFDGIYANHSVTLNWKTASEQNTNYFTIERSSDGQNFESIGTTSSQHNTTMEHQYAFIDYHPNSGANYYRLKTVDFDLSAQYSRTIRINTPADLNQTINVGPNPFSSAFKIQINASGKETGNITIVDLNGKQVYSSSMMLEKGLNNINVSNLENLPAGSYFLKIQSANISTTRNIVKQ